MFFVKMENHVREADNNFPHMFITSRLPGIALRIEQYTEHWQESLTI